MKSIFKTPTIHSGEGHFGGEPGSPWDKHNQSKGKNVIPIKTRDTMGSASRHISAGLKGSKFVK